MSEKTSVIKIPTCFGNYFIRIIFVADVNSPAFILTKYAPLFRLPMLKFYL